MKYVRIGNDIGVKWNIFRNYAPEDLKHVNAKVYLFDRNGRQQLFNYTIEDGYIQGTFYGKDQVTTGNYRLVLTENEGNKEMVTLDYIDAFVLSAKLKNMTQSGEDAAIGIKTDVVELSSTISTDKQFVDLTDYVKREELDIYALKTELFSKDYNDLTNKPTIPQEYDDTAVRNLIDTKQDKLTQSQIANLNADHSKYLTEHQDLSAYAKKVDLQSYALKNHTHSQYALKTDIPDTSSYLTSESDPTVPAYVKSIKQSDIDAWNAATSSVDLSNYVTKNELDAASYITADQVTYPDYSNTYANIVHTHSEYALKTELFSKDYNDLTNKPTIPSEYDDTQVRNLIAGKQDKLNASQIANLNADHSKYLTEHQDLSAYAKKTELFSKDYNDLTNKPTIPSEYDDTQVRNLIAGKQDKLSESQIANLNADHSKYLTEHQTLPDYSSTYAPLVHTHDQYLTEHQDLSAYVKTVDLQSYAKKTDIPDTSSYLTSESDPTVPAYVKSIKQSDIDAWNAATGGVDLSNYVTKNDLDAASYITADQVTYPDYSNTYAPLVHTHDQYLTEHQDLSAYAKKTELFSKDYNDLTNKPTIPSEYDDTQVRNLIASKQDKLSESQIANLNADHSKYLTQHQTLPDYSTTYAPLVHTHDQYLTEHQDLSNYVTKTDLDTSSYLTSESDPTVPAYVKSIKQSDIDAWNAATGGVDLSNYVTKNDLDAASYITADQVTYPDYSNTYANIVHTHSEYALKTELFSKDYNDLTNKPTIPSEYDDTQVRNMIAGKQDKLTESQIANLNADHSKYLTQHQTLPDYSSTYAPLSHTHNQYLESESDPTVPAYVKSITEADITNWNTKYDDTNVLSRLDSIEATLGYAYTISENILNA